MSLPTVVTLSRDHGSSSSKTLTLTKGGSLEINEIRNPFGQADYGRLFGVVIYDDRDLFIRDCITQAIADYLNRFATPSERLAATGLTERVRHSANLREHIMLGVLFLKDPAPGEKLRMMYTPSACRNPYGKTLRQLTGTNCLGSIKSIA